MESLCRRMVLFKKKKKKGIPKNLSKNPRKSLEGQKLNFLKNDLKFKKKTILFFSLVLF